MIRRLVLIGIELLVAFLVIVAAGLFCASYYVDTDEFRSLFTDSLSRATGREILLAGDININLWPEILLEVNDLIVGENPEFGTDPFAHFDTIHINVRVLPLLIQKIMIESVLVDGLEVALISDENGLINLATFMGDADADGNASMSSAMNGWAFSLSNIEVANTRISFLDRKDGRQWQLSGISLRTGEISADTPIPVTVGSGFTSEDRGIRADLTLTGLVIFNREMSDLDLGDATITATVYGDFLPEGADPGQLTSQVGFDWENRTVVLDNFQVQFLGLRAEGSLRSGDLRKDLEAEGHVTVRPFVPSGIITRFAPDVPVASVDGLKSSAFASFFRINEAGIKFEKLVATLDDITVRGDLQSIGFSEPIFDFDLRSTTIDLDRYLPLFRTGTPFVWDDFKLSFFGAFKGRGNIRADGLKVVDTLLSDIRLKVTADTSIIIDAGAIKEGQASVGGSLEAVIGTEPTSQDPTLSLKARIDAESQKDGFAFLHGDEVSLGGVGTISLDIAVPAIVCTPEVRSMDIVNHLTGSVKLGLLNGVARFKGKSEEFRKLSYTDATVKVDVSPGSGPSKYWNAIIAASLRMQGGVDVEMLSVDAQGPISVAWDDSHVSTSGMSVNASTALDMLPEGARRANASARISYDSIANSAEIIDGFLQVLETSINGQAKITGLDDSLRGTGRFSIKGANPKRIIRLLSGKDYLTEDPEAMRNWSLESPFAADESGFTLSEANADIDGMAITGNVAGDGYAHPMLTFAFTGGSLDIDRYLPQAPELTLEEKRTGVYVKGPPVRLPVEFLAALRLNGRVVLEELKLMKIRSRGVTGEIRADNGQIRVSKVLGSAYDGALTADWSGQIGRDSLTTHLLLHVEDMQAGPLTRDLGGKDYVRGLSDVDLDLVSQGATDDDIVSNLNGKVWAHVTKGSFKFSGYPKEGEIAPGTMSKQEIDKMEQRAKSRTPFEKAAADFTVANGVFATDNFRVEAPPMLQSYGDGGFSLPDNTIKFSIRNDFVCRAERDAGFDGTVDRSRGQYPHRQASQRYGLQYTEPSLETV